MFVAEAGTGGLAALDETAVQDAFRARGWVAFRGFGPTAAEVDAFARRFTATHFLGYGRAPFPDLPCITAANESLLALEAHTDNALRPEAQRPDITWLWGEVPAADGGETTFFDGIRVWAALAPATRALLTTERLRFVSRYAWRQLGLPDRASFERFVAASGGTIRAIHADDSADVEVALPATRATRWGGAVAFTSSMCVAGSKGFEAMRVELAEGVPLPDAVWRDVRAALAACREEHRWQAGDLIMLDNTRYLHGRNAHRDPRRRVFLVQTLRASF